jgi:hypothetical protein
MNKLSVKAVMAELVAKDFTDPIPSTIVFHDIMTPKE